MQTGFWIAIAVALLALLVLLGPVLTPFVGAAVLAYLLAPGTDWLERHRLPRWAAALAMILLLVMVAAGLVLILVPVLERESAALKTQFPAILTRLNAAVTPILQRWAGADVQLDFDSLRTLAVEHLGTEQDLIQSLLLKLRAGGAALVGTVGMLVLVPVVLFYLLADWNRFMVLVEAWIPRRWHPQVTSMLADIDAILAQFLRGQLTVMLVLATYYSIALTAARFDTALPIGLLTGLLIFIPYVGFTLGLLLALLAATLQFGNAYGFIAVALIYGCGQILEGFVLTPRLVGERIGLHPLGVIFALLAFGELFGFLGVLIALPASAALLVALRRLQRAYFDSDFYKKAH